MKRVGTIPWYGSVQPRRVEATALFSPTTAIVASGTCPETRAESPRPYDGAPCNDLTEGHLMTTNHPTSPLTDLNRLRCGATYRAVTPRGHTTGEYLGVETAYGEWSILLRHDRGTDSIPFTRIDSIAAA